VGKSFHGSRDARPTTRRSKAGFPRAFGIIPSDGGGFAANHGRHGGRRPPLQAENHFEVAGNDFERARNDLMAIENDFEQARNDLMAIENDFE
jgi:hypothetical protein